MSAVTGVCGSAAYGASGYHSLHPWTEASCKELGIPSRMILQGYGHAEASAGYHSPTGTYKGRRYGDCVDFDIDLPSVMRWSRDETFARLVQAGICPFWRESGSFANNRHIHCVAIGLRDDSGDQTVLPGVYAQVTDFLNGRNGLAGHGSYDGDQPGWALDWIQSIYSSWDAPQAATVVSRGEPLKCYAFVYNGSTRCDVRPVVEALGASISPTAQVQVGGVVVDVSKAALRVEGDHTRGSLAAVVSALKHTTRYTAGTPATITIT